MDYSELFSILNDIFNSDSALENLEKIWQNDRWFRFSSFEKTADFCENQMKKSGLSQVERLSLTADGKTSYGDWVLPRAWDVNHAMLNIDGEDITLADYTRDPCSLVMYSAPTPKEGVTGEVLFADQASEMEAKDLQGKFLFTSGPAKELVSFASENNVLGIITDFFPLYPGVRDHKEQMNGISRWENNFTLPVNETGLFAFSLSPENGGLLREKMKKEKVILTATVDSSFYDGVSSVISGMIPGKSPEKEKNEVLIYGHLYEPGALDNASGCGMILELARCLTAAIHSGILPAPERNIRFVIGWECVGSIAWLLAHPEQQKKIFCGLVADMVGTQEIDNTHLCIWHNPYSNYSFTDELINDIITNQSDVGKDPFPWENKPFSIGTDNILADPYWDIPTVAMITEPALSYHSSMDTPDRIDPKILKRSGVIAGTYLLTAANLTPEKATAYLDKAKENLNQLASQKSELIHFFHEEVSQIIDRSVFDNRENHEQKTEEQTYFSNLKDEEPCLRKAARLIPTRLVPGCLTFEGRPELADAPWQPAWNDHLHMPLFWTDGKRNLYQIAKLCAAENDITQGFANQTNSVLSNEPPHGRDRGVSLMDTVLTDGVK